MTVDADLGEVTCFLDGNYDGYQTGLPLHVGSCIWEQGTEVWVGIRPPIDVDAFGRSDSEAADSKMQIMDVFLWGRCLTEDEIATLPGAMGSAEYNMINLPDDNWQWAESPTRVCILYLRTSNYRVISIYKNSCGYNDLKHCLPFPISILLVIHLIGPSPCCYF